MLLFTPLTSRLLEYRPLVPPSLLYAVLYGMPRRNIAELLHTCQDRITRDYTRLYSAYTAADRLVLTSACLNFRPSSINPILRLLGTLSTGSDVCWAGCSIGREVLCCAWARPEVTFHAVEICPEPLAVAQRKQFDLAAMGFETMNVKFE